MGDQCPFVLGRSPVCAFGQASQPLIDLIVGQRRGQRENALIEFPKSTRVVRRFPGGDLVTESLGLLRHKWTVQEKQLLLGNGRQRTLRTGEVRRRKVKVPRERWNVLPVNVKKDGAVRRCRGVRFNIDRATGDVLWRLGLDGDFALAGATDWFFHQHSPQWQPDGRLLLYDNAVGNPALPMGQTPHSRAKIFELDETTMTAT